MPQNSINVSNLTKQFSFSIRDPQRGWFKNLINPTKLDIAAVKNISFSIKQGECVAFIGPNGSGKSTTIKMLTGILYPSSGSIQMLGLDPTKDRKKLAYQIGTVFGQRSQLFPNLPLIDSLEFFGVMYDLSPQQQKIRINELIELFELGDFSRQPVRKLSLGQRMRAEVAASLVHKPKIILLDEPTIGLDVIAKKTLRDLLKNINQEENTTIFLTSHDVGDIESLCSRTLILNHGELIEDLQTRDLFKTLAHEKYINLVAHDVFTTFPTLSNGMRYQTQDKNQVTICVDINTISVQEALRELLTAFDVEDINVHNTDLEDVIRHIYARN